MKLNHKLKYISLITLLSFGVFFQVKGAPGLMQALVFIVLAFYASNRLDSTLLNVAAGYSIFISVVSSYLTYLKTPDLINENALYSLAASLLIILITTQLCVRSFRYNKRLKTQQHELNQVFAQAKLGSFKICISTKIVFLSQEAKILLSVGQDEITLSKFAQFIDENSARLLNRFVENLANTEVIDKDMRNLNILSRHDSWIQIILFNVHKGFAHGVLQSLKNEQEINFAVELEKEKFDNLINNLPVFLTVFNKEGEILFLSNNLLEFFGGGFEYVKSNWISHLHSDDKKMLDKAWYTALKEPKPWVFKYRLRDNLGKYHHFISHFKPVNLFNSNEVQWYASAFDNTATEQIKLDNEKLLTKLQGIMAAMDNGFISINFDNKIEYINYRAEYILDVPNTPIGQPIDSIESLKAINIVYLANKLKETQITQTLEFTINENIYLLRAHPSSTGINLYIQDVTVEKNSMRELELLRTAIDRATDMVIITNDVVESPGPTIVYANEALERVTGYSRQEIIGQSPRFLQGDETEKERLSAIKQSLLDKKAIRTQLTNYTKEGKPYTNEVDISPIFNSDGKLTNFISIQRDISDQKEQEDLAFRAHKMDSIGLVTGGVAHDFNNLLTIILGNTEILAGQLENKSATPNPQHLQEIREATRQGVNLTRSLLAFSKRQPFIQESVKLNRVIKSVTPLIQSALGAQYQFVINDNATNTLIRGDMAQLESLFLNMSINARDAMSEGGTLTVNLSNEVFDYDNPMNTNLPAGNYLKLQFQDNGSGIKPSDLERIFDPFFSTKALTKGTGLGLSMIYSYVDQSGGHISVESKLEEGTTFTIYLPVSKESYKEPLEEKEITESRSKPDSYSSKSVLICEDTDMVAKVATYIFKSLGFTVHLTFDGESALETFRANPNIDLLFTDIILPGGIDGKELANQIKSTSPDMAVIFTSGFTQGKLNPEDYAAENCAFLQKPYTKKDLINCIGSIFKSS